MSTLWVMSRAYLPLGYWSRRRIFLNWIAGHWWLNGSCLRAWRCFLHSNLWIEIFSAVAVVGWGEDLGPCHQTSRGWGTRSGGGKSAGDEARYCHQINLTLVTFLQPKVSLDQPPSNTLGESVHVPLWVWNIREGKVLAKRTGPFATLHCSIEDMLY